MYICVCHGITDHAIRRAADDGCVDLHELTMRTGLGSGCGSCLSLAADLLAESAATRAFPLPVLQAA